jgi:hypothetical protein
MQYLGEEEAMRVVAIGVVARTFGVDAIELDASQLIPRPHTNG